MPLSKKSKRFIALSILCALGAIVFTVLYFTNAVANFSLSLAVIYVSYFCGIALLYNGGFSKEQNKINSARVNLILGILFVLLSVIMLIYGFTTEQIAFY